MAEQIGSIEYDVSVNDINAQKVLEQIAAQLQAVNKTFAAVGSTLDSAANKFVQSADKMTAAADKFGKTADKMTGAAKDVADAVQKVGAKSDRAATQIDTTTNALADNANAALNAAKAVENLSDSIDTTNHKELAKTVEKTTEKVEEATVHTEAAAAATERLNEAAAATSETSAEWVERINALNKQMVKMAENGSTESAEFERMTAAIYEIISAQKDLTQNPMFTPGDIMKIREYQSEIDALVEKQKELEDAGEDGSEAYKLIGAAIETAKGKIVATSTETAKTTAETKKSGGAWQWFGKVLGVQVPAGATAAKFAIEAVKMALSAGLLTVITMLSEAIMKLVDKLTFGLRMQGELNAKVASSTAEAIANLKNLQYQWNKLGDDLSAKEKFINDNKEAFESLGVAVNSVNDAEKLLVSKTQSFVSALMARARAAAAQELMQERIKDSIEDLAEAESEITKAQNAIKNYQQQIENYKQTAADPNNLRLQNLYTLVAANKAVIKKYEKERSKIYTDIDKETGKLASVIVQANADEEKAIADLGLTQSASLKEFRDTLKAKADYYKKYQSDLNSSDAELSNTASFVLGLEKAQNGFDNYLEYLKNLREEVRDDANKLAIVNEEISRLTQKNKGKTAAPDVQEELTDYERMKLALQDYQKLRDKGIDPTTYKAEEDALKRQIQLYEERNHLVEPPTPDYADKIAKYREFAEKLVEIELRKKTQIDKINGTENLSDTEKSEQIAGVNRFTKSDIEILKNNYGVLGDDLAKAVIDGMNSTLEENEEDIVAKIISLKQQLANLAAQGSTTDVSEQVAKLSAQLKIASDAYEKMKAAATDAGTKSKQATDKITRPEAYNLLKRSISDCAQSFKTLGQQIGGATGEALEFVGDLTQNIMGVISAIETYAQSTAKTIDGVGVSAAAAIRAVESASVILAILEAAMQVAMALVNTFRKDEETYEEKKRVYDAYISTLDTLIDRERKLTETLTAQDAAAHFSKIKKYYEDKIKVEREMGEAYLESRERNHHSEGYKAASKMTTADWVNLYSALGGENQQVLDLKKLDVANVSLEANAYREEIQDALKNTDISQVLDGIYGTRLQGVMDLTADQLKRIQTEAYETYAKLPSEMRGAIEEIIAADEALQQLEDDARAQRTGTSRDTFVDSLKDSLLNLDVTAEKVSENIHEYLRKSLVLDFYKSQMQADINKYYEMWADAMDSNSVGGSDISEIEQAALDAQEKLITDKIEGIERINEKFKSTDEEEDERGLSGAIKNASQESIDLLAGQTNAVRMNQVEGMTLARESLDAVMAIHVQVTLCARYLSSINSAVSNPSNGRSQGII